jgi:hypothetical protein
MSYAENSKRCNRPEIAKKIRGFGFEFDIKSGKRRDWFIGEDGIKRWGDNNQPVVPNGARVMRHPE